jgi:hypothetical protein
MSLSSAYRSGPDRWIIVGVLCMSLGLTSVSGCTDGASKPSTAPSRDTRTTPSASASAVTGRASAPTDVHAPGIVLPEPNATLRVSLPDRRELLLTYQDWNTITGSSRVPAQVQISIDPNFHATATTHNRFQYLANHVGLNPRQPIDAIGVVARRKARSLIGIAIIRNNDAISHRLVNLKVRLLGRNGELLQSKEFYGSQTGQLDFPPRTSYLAWLDFGPSKLAPSILNRVTWSFSYEYR